MTASKCAKCGSPLQGTTVHWEYCALYFLYCNTCGYLGGVDYSRSTLKSRLAYKIGWLDGDLDRWIFTMRLVPFSTKKLKVLDVGAAPGCLTRMVKQLLGYEVYGLDSASIIYADGRLDFEEYVALMKKSGVIIRDCDLDKDLFPFPDQTFNIVLFTEVIEHLHRPRHALSEIYRVLKRKGKLILSTPNLMTTSNRIRVILRKPEITHGAKIYRPTELKKLLEDTGFRTISTTFSAWSEQKFLKKSRVESPKLSTLHFAWSAVKYGLVHIMPSLSSYIFVVAARNE